MLRQQRRGTQLFERLDPALGEIAGALDALNNFRDSPTGTLKLNVPVIVAQKILPPIVNRFLAAYPGITLEISAIDTFIDVLQQVSMQAFAMMKASSAT